MMRWLALVLAIVMMMTGCGAGAKPGGTDGGTKPPADTAGQKPGDTTGQTPQTPGNTTGQTPSTGDQGSTQPKGPLSPADAEKVIASRAKEALAALKAKDAAKLATMAHPDKGIRFSPYPNVRTGQDGDVVLAASAFQPSLFTDKKLYTWGVYDGNGNPIQLSVADYWQRFVYDVDFATAPQVGYNTIIGKGNTVENSRAVYPDGIVVECHFPGFDAKYQGMDWKSLRLVFEQKGGTWYLVGVIHAQWTV